MEILRIPNRYSKQLSRIDDSGRLFIYDSLMKLSIGENVILPDTIVGDILELIWRDSIQMDKKNREFDENTLGNLLPSMSAGNPPGNSHTERKGKEMKGKEKKGDTPQKKEKFKKPTLQEIKTFMQEKNYKDFSQSFHSHYESNGWMVGKNKMKDWKAAVTGWTTRDNELRKTQNNIRNL